MKHTGSRAAQVTTSDDNPHDTRWTLRREHIGAALWCSFLAACLASLLFFGVFDPAMLADDARPPRWLANRMTGYGVLFFFFWSVSAVAAGLTAYLIDTAHEPPRDREQS